MPSTLFPNQPNNPINMINQFKQFTQGMTPQNAKQIIEQKIQSGEISQEQFNNVLQQAQSLMNLFR